MADFEPGGEGGPMTWQHLKAVILLPLMVVVVIPTIILYFAGLDGMALQRPAPWNVLMLVGAAVLLAVGLLLFVTTVSLFARIGRGTLAPWNPPQHLVVVGPYRHVRNPMISGVLSVLLAEALFSGSLPLLGWFAVFFILTSILIPLAEEPGLEKRFGEEYLRYKQNVPRWIPRLTPYSPK
jgi:protein-S-isoprenylcysteine O-methyltransferase Ste14